MPAGIYAVPFLGHIEAVAFIGSPDGKEMYKRSLNGQTQDAKQLGESLAEALIADGAPHFREIKKMMDEEKRMKKGKVYLIGAGPGDPELFTLKGKRCLEKADVIVGDYLADKRILRFANKNAEYIYVGKSCGSHTMTQQDISRLLAEKGKKGKLLPA